MAINWPLNGWLKKIGRIYARRGKRRVLQQTAMEMNSALLRDHMMYTNLLALSPKDYCLIPGNGAIKLVEIGPKIT